MDTGQKEADHSPLSDAEVEKAWNYHFRIYLHALQRDNFIFTFKKWIKF
jgi:hypothetical protein